MIKGMEGALKTNYSGVQRPEIAGGADFRAALLLGLEEGTSKEAEEEESGASRKLECIEDAFLLNMWKNKSSLERKKYDELLEALGRLAVKTAEAQ